MERSIAEEIDKVSAEMDAMSRRLQRLAWRLDPRIKARFEARADEQVTVSTPDEAERR